MVSQFVAWMLKSLSGQPLPEREPAVPDLSRTARIRGVGYNVVSGDDLFPVDRSPASEKYGCT